MTRAPDVDEPGRKLRGRRIRQREEHDVGLPRQHVRVERRDGALPEVRERRQLPGRRGARRGRERHADRMRGAPGAGAVPGPV